MATKRAYKLQEFVAHASNVNCLKIAKKTSRVLLTGGEDHKVNLWAIGKPNAILSLLGHTSPVESVSFDSSEILVAAGAASGTIKLWDLEEAKVVRTLTGHRSNCISIDFHPFGEFFASGSLDTNLKIWDIRRKGCIHTYKGHTRGVSVLRFTPDGRWVVSGGEDNTVKIWDLTAGKLLTDFKVHEGQIQCIDFHPHEFLLATGSADKTVKFWDLETFELIGSSGPETSGVRSMTFNSDGRTLFCGLHESLKVLSWEPIRCHDVVDVGWSRLSDLNVHEGKLLGCSYNQTCVGIWVVDLSLVEPYSVRSAEEKSNASINAPTQTDVKSSLGRLSISKDSASGSSSGVPQRIGSSSGSRTSPNRSSFTMFKRNSSKTQGTTNVQNANKSDAIRASSPRISSRLEATADCRKESADVAPSAVPRTRSKVDLSTNPAKEADVVVPPRTSSSGDVSNKEISTVAPVIVPRISSRVSISANPRKAASHVIPVIVPRTSTSSRADLAANPIGPTSSVIPFILPRTGSGVDLAADPRNITADIAPNILITNLRVDQATDSGRDNGGGVALPYAMRSKGANLQRRDDSKGETTPTSSSSMDSENVEYVEDDDQYTKSVVDGVKNPLPANEANMKPVKFNRTGKFGANRLMEPSQNYDVGYGRTRLRVASWERNEMVPINEGPVRSYSSEAMPAADITFSREGSSFAGKDTVSAGDEDVISGIMEQHLKVLRTWQFRLTKLQVVHRLWEKNDMRGIVNAMQRMSDHAVSADVVSVLMEKSDIITLDICTFLLPIITSILESRFDRHLTIALEMLLKLVKTFGPVISSTLSAAPSVGVDLQAEQRLERCNLCFIELEKLKSSLPSTIRHGGSIGKLAQELQLTLQEVF
ncbi:katanin p80 WD40 repeat-containing subunit B1 homolog KTN80.4-like [Typha angustifolia]|uniref:katanin p80 WD40 repeat-containing subunit B1 homolog KTN80.4-like n=1 Tax=Typha angustifolia TaxID=59011 RepID=UPI003C2F3730